MIITTIADIIHAKLSDRAVLFVGLMFINNPNKLPQINHLNGQKDCNRADNLAWCTNYENQKHAWKNGLIKRRFSGNNPRSKKVNQYDLQGNFIKTWDSMMDIERELKISHTYISLCCRNKTETAKGYIFKYK